MVKNKNKYCLSIHLSPYVPFEPHPQVPKFYLKKKIISKPYEVLTSVKPSEEIFGYQVQVNQWSFQFPYSETLIQTDGINPENWILAVNEHCYINDFLNLKDLVLVDLCYADEYNCSFCGT